MLREPTPLTEEMGRRVRQRREALGLSQRALSARISMSVAAVCWIEKGNSEAMAGTVVRLCRALGVSADWLLGVKPECICCTLPHRHDCPAGKET